VDVSVKVTGLRELASAFKAVDANLSKEMRAGFLEIAQHVAGTVQQRMPFRSGRAASSVKPRATAKGASIAAGGTKAPYYQWLDFGGSVGRGHKPGVGWSGSIKRDAPKGGRYIYPAIAEEREEIEAAVDAAVAHVAKGARFDVSEGL
jgi:hypothetical protein